jgi:hypothetical protein
MEEQARRGEQPPAPEAEAVPVAGEPGHQAPAAGSGASSDHAQSPSAQLAPSGWSRPRPAHAPRPTYWPAILGIGVTCLFWGVVTTWVISLVGLVLCIMALAGWIGEMLHDA